MTVWSSVALERIAAALELPVGTLLQHAGWSGAETAFAATVSDPSSVERESIPRTEVQTSALDLRRESATPRQQILRLREALMHSQEIRA